MCSTDDNWSTCMEAIKCLVLGGYLLKTENDDKNAMRSMEDKKQAITSHWTAFGITKRYDFLVNCMKSVSDVALCLFQKEFFSLFLMYLKTLEAKFWIGERKWTRAFEMNTEINQFRSNHHLELASHYSGPNEVLNTIIIECNSVSFSASKRRIGWEIVSG